jgi:hypothetical protein
MIQSKRRQIILADENSVKSWRGLKNKFGKRLVTEKLKTEKMSVE